jgi:hypothetical protein
MEGGRAPKVLLLVSGESSISDLLKFWIAEDKSRELGRVNEPIDRQVDHSRRSVYHCV